MSLISRSLKALTLLSISTTVLTSTGNIPEATALEPLSLKESANSVKAIISPSDKPKRFLLKPSRDRACLASKQLDAEINAVIKAAAYRNSKWGILVQSLSGTTLYSYHPDSFLIPASNIKLLTTAVALHKYNPLSSIRSKSLGEWVAVTNLKSNNFYADTLLYHIGGSRSVQKTLTKLGVSPLSYHMADGSGLSRKNLVTPRALVKVLQAMDDSPGKNAFFASLPVAGVSGTLKHRLQQKNLEGSVRAKTGTLKGVRSLSGYMQHPQYGPLAFSIIVNSPRQSGAALVKAIDQIVIRLFESSSPECH
jgi:D-alanyl-D-alanine carboxypeptidase/D-alanyl-D-alanine-endopeptidase (penicillin-binding protein 4)